MREGREAAIATVLADGCDDLEQSTIQYIMTGKGIYRIGRVPLSFLCCRLNLRTPPPPPRVCDRLPVTQGEERVR
jgi:hypothetical protein